MNDCHDDKGQFCSTSGSGGGKKSGGRGRVWGPTGFPTLGTGRSASKPSRSLGARAKFLKTSARMDRRSKARVRVNRKSKGLRFLTSRTLDHRSMRTLRSGRARKLNAGKAIRRYTSRRG